MTAANSLLVYHRFQDMFHHKIIIISFISIVKTMYISDSTCALMYI